MTFVETERDPNVDYSDQSWVIAGLPPVTTLDEAMTLIEANELQEVPAT